MMTEEEKRRYHVEAVRRWRKKHPEKMAEYMRNYRKKHPEKVSEINEETKKKRHAKKPKFDRSAYMKEYWRKKRLTKVVTLTPMHKPVTVGDVGKKPEGRPELFDRDKNWKELNQYEQTRQEKDDKRQYESYQKRLELLEKEYDDKRIDLEFYIRERSIILQKMKNMTKRQRTHHHTQTNTTQYEKRNWMD